VQHKKEDNSSPSEGKFTLFTAGGNHLLTKNHDWIAELKLKNGGVTDFKKKVVKAGKSQVDDADQILAQNPAAPREYVTVAEANNVVWPYLAMDAPYFDTPQEAEAACNALAKCQGYVQHKSDDGPSSGKFSTFVAGGKHRLTKEHDWIAELKVKKSDPSLVQVNGNWWFGSKKAVALKMAAKVVKAEVSTYVHVDEAKNVVWPFLAMKTPYFSTEEEAEAACSATADCVGYVQHKKEDNSSPSEGKFTLFTAGGNHLLTKNHDWIAELKLKNGGVTDFKKKVVKAGKSQVDDADQILAQNPAAPREYVTVAEANNVVWPYLAMDAPYFDTPQEAEAACNALAKCQGYVQHKSDDGPSSGKFSTFVAGGKHRLTKEHDWIAELKVKKSDPSLLQVGGNWLFGQEKVVNADEQDEVVKADNQEKLVKADAVSYVAADEAHDALYEDPKFYDTEAEVEFACSISEKCRGYVHRINDDSPNADKFSLFEDGGDGILTKQHDWIAELKIKTEKH